MLTSFARWPPRRDGRGVLLLYRQALARRPSSSWRIPRRRPNIFELLILGFGVHWLSVNEAQNLSFVMRWVGGRFVVVLVVVLVLLV